MQNKCKAVLLPTKDENPVSVPFLLMNQLNKLVRHAAGGEFRKYFQLGFKPQHLYITSIEEIKEEDWIIITNEKGENYLRQCEAIEKKYCVVSGGTGVFKELCTKIIATTDSSLIIEKCRGFIGKEYSLPTIPKSFIELHLKRYNEGNPIVDVLVEYESTKGILQGGDKEDYPSRLKLNGNKIIISETKSSWTREEVIELIKKFDTDTKVGRFNGPTTRQNWIKENL